VQISPDNFDVVQTLVFEDLGIENMVEIQVEGEGNLIYQIAGGYYLPWDKLELYPDLAESGELVSIDLAYDRTELAVNDTVNLQVKVSLDQEGQAQQALIDLGVPPGFSVLAEDLEALVDRFNETAPDQGFPTIERFELTGRQILVYVRNLSFGKPLAFSYRLQARFPLAAQTPPSSAYDYYNPEVSGEAAPLMLVVTP
jgi:hypothetical protein